MCIAPAVFLVALSSLSAGAAPGLSIPPAIDGVEPSSTWSVYVCRAGSANWNEVPVSSVRVGYQETTEPLSKTVGLLYSGPVKASLARFSFDGKIEVRAVLRRGKLLRAAVVPLSYGIMPLPEGNELRFALSQKREAPRKIVIRPNDNWDQDCLHLLTNPPEERTPREDAPEVFCINPGDPVPEYLPEGKQVYYFRPGIHVLPAGLWVDLDLGSVRQIASFDLLTGGIRKFIVPGGLKYRIVVRGSESANWETVAEDLTNAATELRGVTFGPIEARYVRLTLLGNNNEDRSEGFNYLHSAHITRFCLYGPGSRTDLAEGRAVRGGVPGYEAITKAANTTPWGHINAGGAFFVAQNDLSFYLAPGAVLRGAMAGVARSNVSIGGRGTLDAARLVHTPSAVLLAGRTGAICLEKCSDVLLEGIAILDSPMWSMQFRGSTNVKVRHIDYIGAIVNADGVNLSAVNGGLVEGCFLRSCDDLVVVYHYGPSQDLTIRNSVFWNDGGRIVLMGLGDDPGDIRNVQIENCDILTSQGVWDREQHAAAFVIGATAGNAIRGVRFRDIRIEPFRFPSITALMQIKAIAFGGYPPGKVSDVVFDRVSYDGVGEARSYTQGTDAHHDVSGVVFRRVLWGGSLLTAGHHPLLDVRGFSEVEFRE